MAPVFFGLRHPGEGRIFSPPLQGEGWVGWIFYAVSASHFVIPAKAGIQRLAFVLAVLSRQPTHVRVLFVAHPCAPVTSLSLPKEK
jgi:hypothetical protein